MHLIDPATNKLSGESLQVLGFDSDQFADAISEKRKENIRILALPQEEQAEEMEGAEIRMIASLVVGWSFEETLTQEAICELIVESPAIRLQIDKFASDRANFINPR